MWAGKAEALLQAFGFCTGSCGLANVLATVRWLMVQLVQLWCNS